MQNLACFYKSNENPNLRVAFFDGTGWSGNLRIHDLNGDIDPKSDHTPAAAYYKGTLYVVYKGEGNRDVFLTTFDGVIWSGDRRLQDVSGGVAAPNTGSSPALAVFKNLLYLFCGGDPSDTWIYYYSFDGVTWSGQQRAKVGNNNTGTNHGISIVPYNGLLYTIYKGVSDEDLRWMSFDGTNWAGDQTIKNATGGAMKPRTEGSNPGLAVADGKLYFFYKGVGNKNIFMGSFDGSSWAGDTKFSWHNGDRKIEPESSEAPRCFTWLDSQARETLNIVYKGKSEGPLYIASLADGVWSGGNSIYIPADPNSQTEPKSSHAPGFGMVPIASMAGSSDWMTTHRAAIGARMLGQLTLPSSHDTGMHICWTPDGGLGPFAYTTRTQEMDLYSQIVYGGVRMVDLRQVQFSGLSKSGYYSAHYTNIGLFFGFFGQTLNSICADLSRALATLGSGEILMVNVSHGALVSQNLGDTTVAKLDASGQQHIINSLLAACDGHLYKAKSPDEQINFLQLTVNDILGRTGTSTVIFRQTDDSFDDSGNGPMDGCFREANYNTMSTNPGTDNKEKFLEVTASKLRDHTAEDPALFMSWQLTWGGWHLFTSLEEFAASLNPDLGPSLVGWAGAGWFDQYNRPVAIGWDFVKPVNQDGSGKDPTFNAVMAFNGLT